LHLEFADEHLRRLAEDVTYSAGWSTEVIWAYRMTVQLLRAAKDVGDLRGLRSVGLTERADADGGVNSSVRLTGSRRLAVEFPVSGDMPVARLLSIEDSDSKGVGDDT
jgi:plasmid maintenance system killer protein